MSFERCDKTLIDKYMAETDTLIEEIENAPTTVEITGTKYYVAADGNDENDGLSPESAWQTVKKVNEVKLKYGDGVFFKRGDSFRQPYPLQTQNGVTYSAYGEGKKPRFIGSVDASGADKWIQSEYENIYIYAEKIPGDLNVGNIIFDNGRAWGIYIQARGSGKRLDIGRVFNGLEWFDTGDGEFKDYGALKNNLEFHYDFDKETLYLYSKDGNPGEVFESIELSDEGACIRAVRGSFDVTIDNIEMFGGGFGLSANSVVNLTIQYCTFKWIGGYCHHNYYTNRDYYTRLGNAVESYGNNYNFTIHHCYATQVYDCCWTVQCQRAAVMRDTKMYCNVTEYCNTGLEVWQNDGLVENMELHHNYTRLNGYGWSHQRPGKDSNFFYGANGIANVFKNCSVHDNINILSSKYALKARPTGPNQYNFNNNIYIMEEGTCIGGLAENPATGEGPWTPNYEYTKENIERFQADGFEPGSKFYVVEKSPLAEDMYTHHISKNKE